MHKRNYEQFAEMFKTNLDLAYVLNDGGIEYNAIEMIARQAADIFAADNPRFDRSRFLKACGIEEGE